MKIKNIKTKQIVKTPTKFAQKLAREIEQQHIDHIGGIVQVASHGLGEKMLGGSPNFLRRNEIRRIRYNNHSAHLIGVGN